MKKQKCLNVQPKCLMLVFITKNALFAYFWARKKKAIAVFEISTPEFI